jgi:type VI secretion system protein ImpK
MELQYVCLTLGFNGKYGNVDRGSTRLAEIQTELFRRIREYRGVPAPELALHWRGMQDRRNPVIRYVPWWVVGAFALVVLAAAFIYYQTRLGELAAPVNARLAHIGLAQAPVSAAPSAALRLKQLLQDDEAAGVLRVEERGNQTVVTLMSSDLFGSGSAKLNPKYQATLERIARALNQVPGQIFVIGHTDDQALRSLKFQDNFELSRARATEVLKLLALTIDNAARMQSSGVGASEPRYQPPSLPENRARNRRVEIVHVGEG